MHLSSSVTDEPLPASSSIGGAAALTAAAAAATATGVEHQNHQPHDSDNTHASEPEYDSFGYGTPQIGSIPLTHPHLPPSSYFPSSYHLPPSSSSSTFASQQEFYFSDPVTISSTNPYAHQLAMPPVMSGWSGASSLQMHSAHQAANQLRQANASRNRRKRAKGFDEKAILSATRVINCNGVDMACEVEVEEESIDAASAAAAESTSASSADPTQQTVSIANDNGTVEVPPEAAAANSVEPLVDSEPGPIAPAEAAPPPVNEEKDSTDPSASDSTSASDSASLAAHPRKTTLRYPTLYELSTRPDLVDCPEFRLQHGTFLPELHVKFINDITACEEKEDGTMGENLCNKALQWLLEDLDTDGDPIVGIDAEGRQINLLQVSTKSRCVLIRMPKYHGDDKKKESGSVGASSKDQPSSVSGVPAVSSTAAAAPAPPTIIPPPPLVHGVSVDPSESVSSFNGSSASSIPIPPLLREILEDEEICKSGAELWGDSLDIYRDLGIGMNNACNMTKSFTTVLSLEIMVNLALLPSDLMQTGLVWAFKKDKVSTTSTWDGDHLTIRQLIYAALDAQTSYFIGKNLSRPPPFHLSKMSQPWLQQAGSWLLMSKYMESAQEKELRASFEDMSFSDNGLSVLMNQYNKRIRLGSDVTVHLTDGTKVACLVTGVNGKRADLQWENIADVLGKEDVDIERITLTRRWEDTLLPKPVKDYLQAVIHDESENHPIVSSLLSYFWNGPDVGEPASMAKDFSVSSSTLDSLSTINQMQYVLPPELMQQQWITELNESQQYAVALALHNPIASVAGGSRLGVGLNPTVASSALPSAAAGAPPSASASAAPIPTAGSVVVITGPPGSGKCWATGTQIMMYDGTSKAVELIQEGDLLMGDDSQPRVVQPGSLTTGHGALYEIRSAMVGRAPWRCNADHILVLRWPHPTPVAHVADDARWTFATFALDDAHKQVRIIRHSFPAESAARTAHAAAVISYLPFEHECTVLEYLSWPDEIRLAATMFQPNTVRFTTPTHTLKERIQHAKREQTREDQKDMSDDEVNDIAWKIGSSLMSAIPHDLSPIEVTLATVLASYHLSSSTGGHASRTLPHSLLQESIDVRQHLLAGIIDAADDTTGRIKKDQSDDDMIRIDAAHVDLADKIVHLARSLGFIAASTQKADSKRADFTVLIDDCALTSLPLRSNRKRDSILPSSSPHRLCASFTIARVDDGAWHGFTLDGNGRLLLSDFVVTHNTSTIAAIVRTLICDPNCKILCVARTNTAARHMASACAKFIGPHKLTLQVSQEFLVEWHEDQYTELLNGGYVPGMTGGYDNVYRDHQVLVMTSGICFTRPELTQGRTVVICDEASQVWDMEAILFLRAMDCLEKLILFGDSKQLSAYVAPEWRVSANSILDLANLSATRARIYPKQWQETGLIEVKQCMLNVQYRMVKHLGDMISNLFYDGVLRSADTSTVRAVTWHDVRGFSQADEQFSVYNLAEVDEVVRLWRHLCSHGYRADEIVIISMYEAQRHLLQETFDTMLGRDARSNARIHNVDSYQGQESPIIILVLANNMLTEFLKDSRRINVACSRAQQRLYIVGDLSTFSVPEAGVWSKIAAYATTEYKPAMESQTTRTHARTHIHTWRITRTRRSLTLVSLFLSCPVPDMESDFPTLGGASTVSSTPSRPASSWSSATKPSIKSSIKPNPNKSATNATTVMATSNTNGYAAATMSPSTSVAASPIVNGISFAAKAAAAAAAAAPSTPQQPSLMSRLSLAATSSPSLSSTAATNPTSFASLAGSSSSSTPKLTARAAPFVPSKSAVEFVPGATSFRLSSANTAAATNTTNTNTPVSAPIPTPNHAQTSLSNLKSATSSPKIVPNTPDLNATTTTTNAGSTTFAALVESNQLQSIAKSSDVPAVSSDESTFHSSSAFPPMSTPAKASPSVPVPAPSSTAAPMSFAARVAAAAAANQPTTPAKSTATPAKSNASAWAAAAPFQPASTFTPSKASHTNPPPNPSVPSPSVPPPTVSSAWSSKKKSVPVYQPPPPPHPQESVPWTCEACSFINSTAERYCEVCQSIRT